MTFYRNPYGSRCKQIERLLEERGLRHLHWDLDAHEYLHPDARTVADYFIHGLANLEGRAVVLLHDTHITTVKALPLILDWIDAENARRRQDGRKTIRILGYDDVVRERIPPAVVALGQEAAQALVDIPAHALRRLVLPLVGPAKPGHAPPPAQARRAAMGTW